MRFCCHKDLMVTPLATGGMYPAETTGGPTTPLGGTGQVPFDW